MECSKPLSIYVDPYDCQGNTNQPDLLTWTVTPHAKIHLSGTAPIFTFTTDWMQTGGIFPGTHLIVCSTAVPLCVPTARMVTLHASGLVTNKFAGDDFRATAAVNYTGGPGDNAQQDINFPNNPPGPLPDPTQFDITAQILVPVGPSRMITATVDLSIISGEQIVTNGIFEVTF